MCLCVFGLTFVHLDLWCYFIFWILLVLWTELADHMPTQCSKFGTGNVSNSIWTMNTSRWHQSSLWSFVFELANSFFEHLTAQSPVRTKASWCIEAGSSQANWKQSVLEGSKQPSYFSSHSEFHEKYDSALVFSCAVIEDLKNANVQWHATSMTGLISQRNARNGRDPHNVLCRGVQVAVETRSLPNRQHDFSICSL